MTQGEKLIVLCNRLTAIGYARHKNIRLYGEELELIADATPDGERFAIEGIARKSGKLRRMHIPLNVVQMLRREVEVEELARAA